MKKVKLILTEDQKRILALSLIELRNELIREGRYTDAVDELLVKVVD